ncbi:MAG: PulJ/GspJ family protein [Candidatus Rifleibacteriota bacterium]
MKKAFTLVELMVVVGILTLVMIPTYKILSHGSKSAIKGVQRNNIIMHGQQILSQIKSDLTASAFPLVDGETHNINNIFTETTDADGNIKITFYSFSGGEYAQQVIPTSSGAMSHRRLNRIEYRLSSKSGSIFKKLERIVYLHPSHAGAKSGGQRRVLSEQVNFFEIRPETIDSCGFSRSFFRASLQLFDNEGENKTAVPDPEKMFIAEFSETINPLILNSIVNNPGLNRNWYTDPSATD